MPIDDTGPYPRQGFNPQIHGLRGLAALLVFVFHIWGMASVWGFWPRQWDAAAPFFDVGRHGVELFFIISGYLISASLMRHGDVGRFLLDRAIRIYPAFLVIHCLVFALGPVIGWDWMRGIHWPQWGRAFVSNLLFLPGLLDLPLAQKSAWSLSYEAGFYLTASLVFTAFRFFSGVTATIIAIIAALALVPLYPKAALFLPGIAAYILAGAVTGLPRWVRALSLPALIATLFLVFRAERVAWLDFLACLPAFLFFLAAVEGRDLVSALLRSAPLQYLGTISYSFYLWAGVVSYPMKLVIVRLLLGRVDERWIVIVFAAVFLALAIAVSDLSYRYVEKRFGGWLHRLAHRRGAAAAASRLGVATD